jgi:superfamily II DNA/RNA helicase
MEDLDLEGFLRAHEVNSRPWMENLLLEKCNLSTIRPFQLEPAMNLNAGKDLFLVIATGMGKTTALHTPLLAAQACCEKGIAFHSNFLC